MWVQNILYHIGSAESEGDRSDEAEDDLSELTTVQVFARREKKLNEKKELIGTTASKLVEDPESNVNIWYFVTVFI